MRALINDVLGDLGYKTFEAADGLEGLALSKSQHLARSCQDGSIVRYLGVDMEDALELSERTVV